jgi:hypothetical protein
MVCTALRGWHEKGVKCKMRKTCMRCTPADGCVDRQTCHEHVTASRHILLLFGAATFRKLRVRKARLLSRPQASRVQYCTTCASVARGTQLAWAAIRAAAALCKLLPALILC